MKKIFRTSVSILLLAIAVAVTQIPVTEAAADNAASDFQMNGNILVKYIGTDAAVSVPATVTEIGAEAFADNTAIKKITFKGKVEKIGYRAFAGCTSLRQIDIIDSVTEIGNGAFSNCTSLEAAYFGEQLQKIGIGIFAGCSELDNLFVDKKNLYFIMDDGCLYSKDKTKLYMMLPTRAKNTYSMPSAITDIAEYAFWGCNGIKSVSLSSNLKMIPDYAFSNCKSLENISLPYSVTSIAINAFSDCVNLENVYIPVSVSYIHATAFDGCHKLVIKADKGSTAETYYTEWKKTHENRFEYEDTGTTDTDDGKGETEEEKAEGGSQQSGNILASTHVVGNKAVLFIDNTNQKVFGAEAENSNTNALPSPEPSVGGSEGSLPESFTDMGGKVRELSKYTIIDNGILADQAFYKSKDVNGYTIQDGITEIGEFSFARSNLDKAILPQGVTTIGYGAFYHCDTLREVVIPNSVTQIAPKAFDNTLWMENWIAEGSGEYLIVGDGILLAYKGTGGDIIIPEEVKQVGPAVFMNGITISSVTFSDNVKIIGEDAFAGCTNLVKITWGANIAEIKDRAFAGCPIETFYIPSSVEKMGLRAIDYTGTTKGTSGKVAVFEAQEKFPVASYENTAARLSNEAARDAVLKDVSFVIVNKTVVQEALNGSVLDGEGYGFKGIVACISSNEQKRVTCIRANMTREELEAAYIPKSILIGGENYIVEGLEAVLCKEPAEMTEAGVKVINESEQLASADISAELEGNTGKLTLTIQENEASRDILIKAYERVYTESPASNAQIFDMEITDTVTNVPITKMGNCVLSVSIPVPSYAAGGRIRIFTVDRNGQLENVPYTVNEQGSRLTLKTNHLSPFIVCSNMIETSKLDASPDTGEAFHPKWLLAAGLVCLSGAVFFYRGKRRKKVL